MKIRMMMVAVMVAIFAFTAVPASAVGWTVWGLTQQVNDIDGYSNELAGRVGYSFDSGAGGLEPFIGSVWLPESGAPQVMTLGLILHSGDILDPNSPLPWVSDLLLVVLSEDMVARPYAGFQSTINLFDKDAGFSGAMTGVLVKTTPDAVAELVFEMAYDNKFLDWSDQSDNELRGYIGIRYPF